jgi:aryl-alcohol dehydrogenase-like predicted oxidoreductase
MNHFRTLGKSGLRVSPLSLGAMTFGWPSSRETSRELFIKYREAGGNLIDTADLYSNGQSESWIGEFMEEFNCRDEMVILTKFSFNSKQGDPNAGGNGRKHIMKAVDSSLKRLRTNYIDIYMLHAWDTVTPVEEVMSTLNDLVRSGKVHYLGFSNVPAWYAARAATIAELKGYAPISVFQLEYSLLARNLEKEHIPLAKELGIGIMPWSPLASGFLSGKYRLLPDGSIDGDGRVSQMQNSGNPVMEKYSKDTRNWKILDVVVKIANQLNTTPSAVALAWVLQKPQVTSVLIGASKTEHLTGNLKSFEVVLPEEAIAELDEVSKPPQTELDHFFGKELQGMVHGGTSVKPY